MAKEILLIEIREDGARVVKRNIASIGDSADKTQSALASLKTVLGGLISTRVLKDTVMLADTYANLLNRIRVVTSSANELNQAMAGVARITRETRTSLEGNVDMYARVALNTNRMGLAMKDVLRFSTQLNHAIVLSGVTAREAQWGMVQFSQALAAGALRGDELRAVMEQLPVVTDVITSHLGITRGELRKLAFEGRVTTQVIVDAFNAAEKELAERFGKRIPTIDQGLTVLRGSFIRFIGEQDQAWQGTSKLAQALLWVADNMDTLGRIAQIAGTLIGGILVVNTLKLVASWKLFNLALLETHPVLLVIATMSVGLVVFADKIKLAQGEAATLADTVRAFGPEFTAAGEAAGEMWNKLADSSGLDNLKIKSDITLEGILITLGRAADGFAGIMSGIGNMVINGVKIIGDQFMQILRHIGAFFEAVWDKFKRDLSAMRLATETTALAAREALRGNLEMAKAFGKTALAAMGTAGDKSVLDFYLVSAKEIESTFRNEGQTASEAFWDGFNGAGTASEDMMKRVVNRARGIAAARTEGKIATGVDEGALTPQQAELLKEVTGDTEQLIKRMADLKVLFDTNRISVEEYNRALVEMKVKSLDSQLDTASGFKKGFMEVGLEITNFSDQAASTVTNAFASMEDALVSFVTTGKVDFKSLVDSILGDLTRLLARQALVSILGFILPGGSLLSSLAEVSTGGTTTAAAATPRANGGPVSAGEPYWVGERGPEPFIPDRSGKVISNEMVTSATQAAATQAPAQINIVNVWSTDDILDTMNSTDGERIIVNKSPGRKSQK
jgi:tape measure domain-containing protein